MSAVKWHVVEVAAIMWAFAIFLFFRTFDVGLLLMEAITDKIFVNTRSLLMSARCCFCADFAGLVVVLAIRCFAITW